MKKFIIFLGVVCGAILGILAPVNYVLAEEIDDEVVEEINEKIPDIYIKAVNPGYTVGGKSNVGEMIEIGRKSSDAPVSLAGLTVGYTNSSGNYYTLVEFPEYSFMAGETLLLRLASSPDSELAAVNYTKTLAFKGGIELKIDDKVVDSVCWTGKDGCYKDFKSVKPTVLVRNLKTGEFEHLGVIEYEPDYNVENYYVEIVKEEEGYGRVASQCKGLQFSEILSYYESSKTEQFIEFYNAGSEQILLDGCQVRYKNKNYGLSGVVGPEGYYVYYPNGFNLTKNPTNYNTLEIIDTDGTVVDTLEYSNGQRKGTSYMFVGYNEKGEEIWKVTYAPTPGGPNNYQEFKTCEEGKVINKVTGNCVKVTSVAEKVCKEGYFLNVLTVRCNKIKTTAEKTCKEGYELNPETNRCRKIKQNTGANYSLEPENYTEQSSFVALYAVLGVVGAGMIYLVYEFRHEIIRKFSLVKESLVKKLGGKTDQK